MQGVHVCPLSLQYEKAKETFLHACRKAPSSITWRGVGIACFKVHTWVTPPYLLQYYIVYIQYYIKNYYYLKKWPSLMWLVCCYTVPVYLASPSLSPSLPPSLPPAQRSDSSGGCPMWGQHPQQPGSSCLGLPHSHLPEDPETRGGRTSSQVCCEGMKLHGLLPRDGGLLGIMATPSITGGDYLNRSSRSLCRLVWVILS